MTASRVGPVKGKCAQHICAITAASLAGAAHAQFVQFTQEAQARGLGYYMAAPEELATGMFGAGCGFADLDSDGDQDVIILGGALSANDPVGTVGLFENLGGGYFTSRSAGSGIAFMPNASGFAAADYNADGLIDLFITRMGGYHALYRNSGNFQFAETTAAAGMLDAGPNMGASWADYNNDGWLDLHICSYNFAVPGFNQNDKLYRNLGNGSFQDVSVQLGVSDPGLAFQSVWFDYDRDGDVDLYISHDRGHFAMFPENKLYRNDNSALVNVSAQSGAGVGLFSMGIACGDFDGNSWPDLYVTNLQGYSKGYNRLLLNQGDGTFVQSAAAAGVDHWKSSWGAIFFDFDHNGALDLFVNNQFLPNTLYANPGTFPCTVANVGVTGNTGWSYGSAVGDIDNDGDLDLLTNNLSNQVELFINHHASPERRSLQYKVAGEHPNLNAIGVAVDTRIGSTWRFREIYAGGNNYEGQNDFTVHVGANAALVADEVIVRWPGGGATRTFTNVPTNVRWNLFPPSRLGDFDDNQTVNLIDFQAYVSCHNQSLIPGFEMMDFDGNWQVNNSDFHLFLNAYDEPLVDCDGDGFADLEQILNDPALDEDEDGILDACEPDIAGDINGDGAVDVDDLVEIINAWGPCKQCAADIAPAQGDGVVNVDDLLVVIQNWN